MPYLRALILKFKKNYQAEFLRQEQYAYFNGCQKILDIGCGIGDFVKLDPERIVGLDQNKESLKVCRQKKLKVVQGQATKIPFPNQSFDGVNCRHVIEHLLPKDAHQMLKEIARVLKPDGVFVIATPILWKGFYNDFTHIKPYHPQGILRYLCDSGEQKTLTSIKSQFEKIDFYWRYQVLPFPGKIGYLIANFLYQFGLHSFQKNGYTLVLRKK